MFTDYQIRQWLEEKAEEKRRREQRPQPIARAYPGGGSLMITPHSTSVRFGDGSGIGLVNGQVVIDWGRK
ncbi:hypothetical protein [Methylobacterium crusticola]|uniref:hypothetical protein n=1 Tax=Methylobacterium crusticola TaxID=1697972 RepID=UPI000FFBDE2A|nr:hypothetical protein [Methylobacterium crusticola]